jgi:hypothetical protein
VLSPLHLLSSDAPILGFGSFEALQKSSHYKESFVKGRVNTPVSGDPCTIETFQAPLP